RRPRRLRLPGVRRRTGRPRRGRRPGGGGGAEGPAWRRTGQFGGGRGPDLGADLPQQDLFLGRGGRAHHQPAGRLGSRRLIEILPLTGVPEIRPGDDLAGQLTAAMAGVPGGPRASDILVVTQKIVSKAENLFVDLASVEPDGEAIELAERTRKDPRLVALILRESVAVVRAVPGVLITRHRSGCVMANGGIDQSNLGPGGDGHVLLLPRDPDAAAARLREALGPGAPAVIISDSFGRPWRVGLTNVAIRAAGFP